MTELVHSWPAVAMDKLCPPREQTHVVIATRAEELERHIPAWEALALDAIEPNPFYEHWMLIPALREMAAEDVRVLFIYDRETRDLWGVLPIVRRRTYRMLPIPSFSFWQHKYCFLCTPLLRTRFAQSALRAYLDWIERNSSRWSVIEFNHTSGEGVFPDLLNAELERRHGGRFHVDTFARAMIRPATSDDSYLRHNVSNGRRKEWRRQFNRLLEQGSVEFVELQPEDDAGPWIRSFMDLEASGWKGRAGSAIRQESASRRFFIETMTEAFRRRRLMMLGLLVDGRPIALKCNILSDLSDAGAFAFKIAYREEFSRFSPGLQLELETIRRLHRQHHIQWMDSCAVPDHVMINTLWAERRRIQTVAVPAPGLFAFPIRSLVGFRARYGRAFTRLFGMEHP